MELEKAHEIALKELYKLGDYVLVGFEAGSIRRQSPDVKDIELVVRLRERIPDNFYPAERIIKNGQKYKQIALEEGINLDLFIVSPPADWGVILTIRTGPPDFSRWIVTRREKGGALPDRYRVNQGAVWEGKEKVECFNEIDFLNLLDLGWIEPKDRYPQWHKFSREYQ